MFAAIAQCTGYLARVALLYLTKLCLRVTVLVSVLFPSLSISVFIYVALLFPSLLTSLDFGRSSLEISASIVLSSRFLVLVWPTFMPANNLPSLCALSKNRRSHCRDNFGQAPSLDCLGNGGAADAGTARGGHAQSLWRLPLLSDSVDVAVTVTAYAAKF